MTLDQWYQTNKGQSLLVGTTDNTLRGQCFIMFDSVLHDVDGLPYLNAPGAIDIWKNDGSYNLSQYFDFIPYSPTMPIKKGDFVIYGPGVGSPFGHVDVAAQDGVGNNYVGYDSNWGHNLTVHTVNHNDSYNQYILGILRLKSNNGGNMKPDPNQINQLVTLCWGPGNSTPADIEKLNAQASMQDALNLILSDARTARWDAQVYQLLAQPAPGTSFKPYSGPTLYVQE